MNQPNDKQVSDWVQLWKQGDQEAAQDLFDCYAEKLARLANANLEDRLQRRVSGDDIVQSVFHSFFQRTANDKIKVEDARSLWSLLVTMTLAKARSAGRHHRALKRTVESEAPSESLDWMREGLAQGPSPVEVAVFVESVEQLTADLPPKHQEILALRMLGHAHVEIARQTSLSRQTVYRVMQLVEKRILDADGTLP